MPDAYKKAGYGKNSSRTSLTQNAFTMEREAVTSNLIQAEIARLQRQAEKGAILKRQERQALLTEIAMNPDNDMPDRLRSIDQLNRMSGDYTDNIRSTVNAKLEMSYAERIAAIKADIEE